MHNILSNIFIKKNRSRKKLSSSKSESDILFHTLSQPIQGTLITLSLLPALFSCCIEESVTSVMKRFVLQEAVSGIETLDIFTFNDDILQRLDSYQRLEDIGADTVGIRSQNGPKHIVVCANSNIPKEDWAGINSLTSLVSRHADLAQERRGSLFMSGSGTIEAGTEDISCIALKPLAGEVVLRSIKADFTGRAYADAGITDVKVYLTNVNARCSILAEGEVRPTHIINSGGLDEEQTSSLSDPSLVFRTIGETVGNTTIYTDIRLLCYPSSYPEESPGTPFTRLVIEGRIDGETFWWPICINREKGCDEPGIFRNRSYIHDIVITGKGSSAPDEDIVREAIYFKMEIRKWEEKDKYYVRF